MKIAIPIVFAFFLLSCNKKYTAEPIIAGDTKTANEIGFNFLSNGANHLYPHTFRLDLDDDGMFDVEVYNGTTQSGSNGLQPVITIETLHANVAMHVNIRQDSIYQANFFHMQNAPTGGMAYFYSNVTSCLRESIAFHPVGVETNKYLIPLGQGDVLSPTADFANGKFDLTSSGQHTTEIEFFPDSTVYHFNEVKSSCFEFPENAIRYIGFRISGDYGEKLGWIEMEYLGESRLRVWDWAIQR